jgi:hypothetical protein
VNLVCFILSDFRKISPGLIPPGSPGIFRRKSSTADLPPCTTYTHSTRASIGDILAHKMAVTGAGGSHTAWPNSKDDYELKEVIGSYDCSIVCSTVNVSLHFITVFVCI